jgi:HK97 family phage major capsid protein
MKILNNRFAFQLVWLAICLLVINCGHTAHGMAMATGAAVPDPVLDEIKKHLLEIKDAQEKGKAKYTDFEKALADVVKENSELKKHIDLLRKRALTIGPENVKRKGWVVSPDCAKHLAATTLMRAAQLGKLNHLDGSKKDWIVGHSAEILGMEQKTALTTTDIPLPTEFMGDIVELVFTYGQARQFATVFPLGAGTVKLPKLSTDPTFGFISAISAAVPEKSPQIAFVQFDAQKAGGIVRIPTEIDADSIVPMGQFIARYGSRNLARWEDTVFFNADGSGTYNSLSGVCKSADTASKKVQLVTTKTKPSDITLADLRTLRSVPNAAALGRAGYYFHPTMEALFATFNTSATVTPYRREAGSASIDGFPINWVNVLPVYDTSAHVSQYQGTFGELEYWYFGERGQVRVDVSNDIYFATDEVGVRFLERFVPKPMADDANAVLQLAAS